MVKKQLLALCTLLMMVMACSKKNKDSSPPVPATIKKIQDYLLQTDSLKTFGNSFKQVSFTDADVSAGITVFAPVHGAIISYDPNARVEAVSLTPDEVKDHIVKGIIRKVDLSHGKKLTTLSGKELLVTLDGDAVMINGVKLFDTKVDTGSHFIIHTMGDVLCKKTGAVEITVLDGTQWTATDTLGKPVANADVALYNTRYDYSINRPAFTGKTDASGKITITGLNAATYYLVVKNDDKYNFCDPGSVVGKQVAYKPLGIFQNANQINSLPHLPNTVPGDFIFQDTDFNGVINSNDKTYIPFEVVVTSNKTIQVRSLIGYTLNHVGVPFTSKAEAQQYLDNIYAQLGNWHQLQAIIDGMLSDDADCSALISFCSLDNFSITPANTYTTSLWQAGYGLITLLNRVILNVPALNLPAAESNNLIAQAKGLRSFVYLQLVTYFGELPLQTKTTDDNLLRSALSETYQFIKSDLTDALGLLPNRFTGADHRRISADACKLLLARIAMAQGDHLKAKQLSGELIQSSTYSLVNANDIFVNDENAEIIWNINPGIVSAYSTFFNSGTTKNFSPAIRYAEVLLINAESRIAMGELDATNINQLLTRRNQPTITFASNTQARDAVQLTWKNELYREGQRFAKLVKWGTDLQVLGSKGFKEYNRLMPIPQYLLNKNPNMMQNAGY